MLNQAVYFFKSVADAADLVDDALFNRIFADKNGPKILCQHSGIQHQLLQPISVSAAVGRNKTENTVLHLPEIVIGLRRADNGTTHAHRMDDHGACFHDKGIIGGNGDRHADGMAATEYQ